MISLQTFKCELIENRYSLGVKRRLFHDSGQSSSVVKNSIKELPNVIVNSEEIKYFENADACFQKSPEHLAHLETKIP